MSILSTLISKTELTRLMRPTLEDDSAINNELIWLPFDAIVMNIETAFDYAIKKRITEKQSSLGELDLEDVQQQANNVLEDEFGYDLDFMETGIALSKETAKELKDMIRGGALTQIDTRACEDYVTMKRPIRGGLLEELRQAVNNHYLSICNIGREIDDVDQLYNELERICDQYADVFEAYQINQNQLRNEVSRVRSGLLGPRDFRDPPVRESAKVISIDRARRKK